jgi:hypothetical protein
VVRPCAAATRGGREGETAEAAIEDLRNALIVLVEEFGVPDELTVNVDVA